MKRPDFFLVGAPKCGTTALSEYLKSHPQIYIPDVKEPHMFGSDLVFHFPRLTLNAYLANFADAPPHKRAGESSVWYLFSRRAAVEIWDFAPRARVIMMLRNPVDMMHSLHAQRVYNGNEDLADFAGALAAEQDRREGRRLPARASDGFGMLYRDVARFADQVERYLAVFGRERVHVINFDDFASNPGLVYAQTCEFLGVDSRFQADFRVINAHKTVRSEMLRDLLHQPPRPVALLFRALRLRATPSSSYKGWLKRLNSKTVRRRAMPQALREALQTEFATEIKRLSLLLGRDFTHWSRR